MSGAFLISREIFENSIWQSPIELRMFLLIFGKAVFSDEGAQVGPVHLKKGQWVRSFRNLQDDLEYIENNAVKRPGLATIKRIVDKLVKDGRVTAETCELGTLFTVVNYAYYQDLETYKKKTRNSAKNSSGTAAEQQRNNNNNANNAEEGNINPLIIPPGKTQFLDYVFLTPAEHERLLAEYGEVDTSRMIEILDNYIGQTPKKRVPKWTDHNRVLRGWVKDKLLQEKAKVKPTSQHKSDNPLKDSKLFGGMKYETV